MTTENTAPTDDSEFSTKIPERTDAGTYYVWYKSVGDENHAESVSSKPVEVRIEKAALTLCNDAEVYWRSADCRC